ncbi:MAG: hypothetical protein ACRENA_13180 [Vulcanimicrobiaceae bacterium]
MRVRFAGALTASFAITTLAAGAQTPAPYASSVHHLQQRMHVMLTNVARHNEQTDVTLEPNKSGLRTIVRVTVGPSFRRSLTKGVDEYIEIHKGDCRRNTVANRSHMIPLSPIANGVSQTEVNVPLSTLTGHGNVITTRTADGTVVDCGSL